MSHEINSKTLNQQVLEIYNEGHHSKTVSRRLGISRNQARLIRDKLIENGSFIPREVRREPKLSDEMTIALQLYREGNTSMRVSEVMGISFSHAKYLRQKLIREGVLVKKFSRVKT